MRVALQPTPQPLIGLCIGGSDPSPPYTGQLGGGGTVDESTGLYRRRVHGRELGPCDHVTGHVTIPGRRGGGDPSHDRSRDITYIGRNLHALGLIGPAVEEN